MRVPDLAWAAWVVVGLVLEGIALTNGLVGDTLTENILRSLPGWAIYAALGWLLWHFRKAR